MTAMLVAALSLGVYVWFKLQTLESPSSPTPFQEQEPQEEAGVESPLSPSDA